MPIANHRADPEAMTQPGTANVPKAQLTPTLVPESGVKSLWYGLTAFVTQLPHLSHPSTSLLLMSGSFVHNPIIAGCKRFASPLPSGPHQEGQLCRTMIIQ